MHATEKDHIACSRPALLLELPADRTERFREFALCGMWRIADSAGLLPGL